MAPPDVKLTMSGDPVRVDDSKPGFWSELSKFAGAIVFAQTPIEERTLKVACGGVLCDRYFYKDMTELHMCGVWGPAAIRNRCLGTLADGMTPVYGPAAILSGMKHQFYSLDFLTVVRVNGKAVNNSEFMPIVGGRSDEDREKMRNTFHSCYGALQHIRAKAEAGRSWKDVFESYSPAGTTDYYAYDLSLSTSLFSCTTEQKVFSERRVSISDGSVALSKALIEAGPGTHEVEVDLCYRIAVDHNSMEEAQIGSKSTAPDPYFAELFTCKKCKAFTCFADNDVLHQSPSQCPKCSGYGTIRSAGPSHPIFVRETTPISRSLASGKFFVVVGEGDTVIPVLPVRSPFCKIESADELEKRLFEYLHRKTHICDGKKEHCMAVALVSPEQGGEWHQTGSTCGDCSEFKKCLACKNAGVWFDMTFKASFYRSPADGWEKECGVSYDAVVSTRSREKRDILGIQLGDQTQRTFDINAIPLPIWSSRLPHLKKWSK